MTKRAEALADRLERGVEALTRLAQSLSNAEWTARVPRDGRSVGVVVHHVATMLPIEVELAQTIARGDAVVGLSWNDVHAINARHATQYAHVTKTEAIALLQVNASAAAFALRAFTDAELDRATPNSLYSDAPLTCQFFIEDHALRHSYHHLAGIQRAITAMTAKAA